MRQPEYCKPFLFIGEKMNFQKELKKHTKKERGGFYRYATKSIKKLEADLKKGKDENLS